MGKRRLAAQTVNNVLVVVYRDVEWCEFVVIIRDATTSECLGEYNTTDKEDAYNTAYYELARRSV